MAFPISSREGRRLRQAGILGPLIWSQVVIPNRAPLGYPQFVPTNLGAVTYIFTGSSETVLRFLPSKSFWAGRSDRIERDETSGRISRWHVLAPGLRVRLVSGLKIQEALAEVLPCKKAPPTGSPAILLILAGVSACLLRTLPERFDSIERR